MVKPGNKFSLQADEATTSKGGRTHKRADVEFVTKPLDETKPDDVRGVARGISAMCQDLSSRPTDAQGWSFPGEHGLNGRLAYQGIGEWSFKTQFTADIRKGNIARVMEDLGNPMGEGGADTLRRAPGRQMLGTGGAGAGVKVMGTAPQLARNAIARLHGAVGGNTFAPAKTDSLTGFRAIMVQYVKMASMQIPSYAKVIAPLMSRHNLAKLFETLSSDQRDHLAQRNGQPLEALLIDAANDRLGLHPADTTYAAGDPVFRNLTPNVPDPDQPGQMRRIRVLSDITIGAWARGVSAGQDYLTSLDYTTWARQQNAGGPMTAAQSEGADQLESLGAKGKESRFRDASGTKASAFEMRAAARMVPVEEIEGYMVAVTNYFRDLATGGNPTLTPPAEAAT